MGYIRSNEDYFRALGYSPEDAMVAGVMADRGISDDDGFCNPLKLRQVKEAREEIRVELGFARSHSSSSLPLIEVKDGTEPYAEEQE